MHRRLLLSLCALAPLCASLAHAQDLPPAASLIEKFIARSGGAEAYARAKNVEMSGTVEITGRNIAGTVNTAQSGDKSWTSMELPGVGKIEQGFDGDIAWEMSAIQGPRIMEGDEKSAVKRASGSWVLTSWRDEYKDARTDGSESINGSPAWKVVMTPKEGKPETFYFDKENGLLVRLSTVVSSPLGDISADVYMSDYREVNGIMTPSTMTQKAMSQSIVMHFDKINYNAKLPAARFDLPVSIKALVAKRNAQ